MKEDSYDPRKPGFDTETAVGRLEKRAWELAPDTYAGTYEDEVGMTVIGLTGAAPNTMALLRNEFPSVPMRDRRAHFSLAKLIEIQNEISDLMATEPELISVGHEGPGPWCNTVGVGVADPSGELAWRLKRKYGLAVRVHQGREIEPL